MGATELSLRRFSLLTPETDGTSSDHSDTETRGVPVILKLELQRLGWKAVIGAGDNRVEARCAGAPVANYPGLSDGRPTAVWKETWECWNP